MKFTSFYELCDYLSVCQKYLIFEKEILDIFNNDHTDHYTNNDKLFIWIGNYYKFI